MLADLFSSRKLKIFIKILIFVFIILSSLYLYYVALPFSACVNETLHDYIKISKFECRGENYDVVKGMTIFYGLILLSGLSIITGLFFYYRRRS